MPVHHEKNKLTLRVNVKIFIKRHIETIMTRSEWNCKTCGEEFQTKGKRDGHRERIHRQRISIGVEDRRIERSGNGKFICKCGKDYKFAPSLRRHQKNCKEKILSKEIGNDE